MSFDVFLIPSDASPTGAEADEALDQALALCGARRGGSEEADFVLASGQDLEFFGSEGEDASGMFALRGLNEEIANLIFEIADATRCFIIFPCDDPTLLRTPSSAAATVDPDGPDPVEVPDAAALLRHLRGPARAWSDYAADVAGTAPIASPGPTDADPTLLDRFFRRSDEKD